MAKNSTYWAVTNAGFNSETFPRLKDIMFVTEPEAAAIYTSRYFKEEMRLEFLKVRTLLLRLSCFLTVRLAERMFHSLRCWRWNGGYRLVSSEATGTKARAQAYRVSNWAQVRLHLHRPRFQGLAEEVTWRQILPGIGTECRSKSDLWYGRTSATRSHGSI